MPDDEERRQTDHAFTLLMDKLTGMDKKLDTVTVLVNKHEVDIASVKLVGKMAHWVGWPALAAGLHHAWQQLNK